MNEICLLCGENVDSDGHFWKKHKIKLNDYYLKYVKKKDLHTNELIPFKSREQYVLTDFITRTNLKHYIDSIPTLEEKQEFCLELLMRRKEIKNLIWTPTQVELKSLILPTMLTYNSLFKEGYYNLCAEHGFTNKFEYIPNHHIVADQMYVHNKENYHIIVDTREQTPLKFDYPIRVEKLDFGDYSFSDPKLCLYTYVERKNITDFISTISSGYERFQAELQRCYDYKSHLVVVVESSFNYVMNFNYSKWLSKFVKASPDFVFHRVRSLCQQFPNVQFVFVDGPEKAAHMTQLILTSNGICRKIDLQYCIDSKLI